MNFGRDFNDYETTLVRALCFVECSVKPYSIPGSASGLAFSLISLTVVGKSSLINVPSPSKRALALMMSERENDSNGKKTKN